MDEMLACEINEHPAQPVQRANNEIEFFLATPVGDATRVTFCFAARTTALDPVSGRIDLELPRTDLFIHSLQWQLTIPQVYETTAIEGNVAIDSLAEASPAALAENVIPLKKELIRGEAPAVELYYQRRGLNE